MLLHTRHSKCWHWFYTLTFVFCESSASVLICSLVTLECPEIQERERDIESSRSTGRFIGETWELLSNTSTVGKYWIITGLRHAGSVSKDMREVSQKTCGKCPKSETCGKCPKSETCGKCPKVFLCGKYPKTMTIQYLPTVKRKVGVGGLRFSFIGGKINLRQDSRYWTLTKPHVCSSVQTLCLVISHKRWLTSERTLDKFQYVLSRHIIYMLMILWNRRLQDKLKTGKLTGCMWWNEYRFLTGKSSVDNIERNDK